VPQKPIRYYITRNGDEPTVRSVAVALGQTERDEREAGAAAEAPAAPRETDTRRAGVTRLVKSAIKKQPVGE
jgi:hypothetical protein